MPPKKKVKADKDQQRLSSFFVSNISPSPSSLTHALASPAMISSHKFVCIGPLRNPIHKSEPHYFPQQLFLKVNFVFKTLTVLALWVLLVIFFCSDRKLLITGFLEKFVFIEFQLKSKYLFS